MIARIEKPHQKQLEQLAIDLVTEMYNVPPHVLIKASIKDKDSMDMDPSEQDDEELKLSPDRKKYIDEQIQKRILLNALVQGSAMHIWKSSHYIVQERINQISPSLIDLYDTYTTITGFQLWQFNIQHLMDEIQEGQEFNGGAGFIKQGFSQVKFQNKDNPTIESNAVNFPVLLHECTKGAIDFLICHGIPQDLSSEELVYYYSKADDYKLEPWFYYLAPSLWNDLLEVVDKDSTEIPKVIASLSKLKLDTLTEILSSVIENPEQAKIKMQVWGII